MSKQHKIFIPIHKIDEERRLVYGIATAESPDKQGEICDYETTKPFYEKWSSAIEKASDGKSKGNLRVMHGSKVAGTIPQINFNDEAKQIEICGKVIDDDEWKMVLAGGYTGFSQGGSYEKKWKDGEFTRYTSNPCEISLVDNPCLSSATFEVLKSDGSVELRKFQTVEQTKMTKNIDKDVVKSEVVQGWKAIDGSFHVNKSEAVAHNEILEKAKESSDSAEKGDETDDKEKGEDSAEKGDKTEDMDKAEEENSAQKDADYTDKADKKDDSKDKDDEKEDDMGKREFTQEERDKAAESGEALPDGSFPIKTKEDLANAIQAYGRAKDKAKAKAHIIARAKALGAEASLPEGWDGSKKSASIDFKKYSESAMDVACALDALQSLSCLFDHESFEAMFGENEPGQLADLKEAISRIRSFIASEIMEDDKSMEMSDKGDMNKSTQTDDLIKKLEEKSNAELQKLGGVIEGLVKRIDSLEAQPAEAKGVKLFLKDHEGDIGKNDPVEEKIIKALSHVSPMDQAKEIIKLIQHR